MFELCQQYLFEAAEAVQVEIGLTLLEVHGENESCETEVMIAVKVTDKNMINTTGFYIKAQHLLLRAFAAINQI